MYFTLVIIGFSLEVIVFFLNYRQVRHIDRKWGSKPFLPVTVRTYFLAFQNKRCKVITKCILIVFISIYWD